MILRIIILNNEGLSQSLTHVACSIDLRRLGLLARVLHHRIACGLLLRLEVAKSGKLITGGCGMIVLVEQHNAAEYSNLMDEMFRLRARVFRDQLGWDVEVAEGKERDKYDNYGPVYLIYTDDEIRVVKGSMRLLPTTGPTLLADIFSDTLPDGVHLSAPTIWECTRFCLDYRLLGGGNREQLQLASAVLIAALGEIAISAGIESILGNFDNLMLRLYRRIGCKVDVLGSTRRFGRPIYLGLFPISEPILSNVKRKLKSADSAIDRAMVAA
jgi:N-acyl-L-homoserine lactone synthetase